MTKLQEIIEGLSVAYRDRVRMALRLLHQQAAGSEKFRTQARTILKEDESPVTVADLVHQAQWQHLLDQYFQNDGFIAEEPRSLQDETIREAARASHEFYGLEIPEECAHRPETGQVIWMLDPIDGTKGYLAGRFYAIAVGFFAEGKPVFGAMAVPAVPEGSSLRIAGSIAFAVAGHGAWITSATDQDPTEWDSLEAKPVSESDTLRVAVSLEHSGGLGEKLKEARKIETVKLDSQAKYLAVATGDIDGYLRQARGDGHPDVMWDHLAGALIASEAGCRVCQFDGEPMPLLPRKVIPIQGGFACLRPGATSLLDAVKS
jgi:3'(2'), 5'-bisphosphate nucleotidase